MVFIVLAYRASIPQRFERTTMNPITIGIFVFACTFGSVLAGLWLRAILPQHHLDEETQATVKVGIGLIATMTALVLGLVTASAKGSFDALDSEVKSTAAVILTLDRTLDRYGPETEGIREALYRALEGRLQRIWPQTSSPAAEPDLMEAAQGIEGVAKRIRGLAAQNDEQRWFQARAMDLGETVLEARWAMRSKVGTSVPVPFLVVLVFWLIVIFASYGLFAPRNGTAIAILFVCALSVASAIFLILEMDDPFTGVIRISPDPLNYALAHINQ